MMTPFNQQPGIPLFNQTTHRVSCCMVIPFGIGVPLVLTSWIGISVYFAALSFMNKSPFYSHLHKSAIVVFGALNLIFAVVCCFGYSLHLIKRTLHRYRQYAKLLAFCVAILILDMIANFILFCIQKDQFQTWCQTNAQNNLNLAFFNLNQLPLSDQISSTTPTWVYNCSKLFTVEAKFSFGCIVCMVIVYAYWVSFIIKVSRNFIFIRPEIQVHHQLNMQPVRMAPNENMVVHPATTVTMQPLPQESIILS